MAEQRALHPAELPAPAGGDRTARSFTPEERARVADYARQHTIGHAASMFGIEWATVRNWVEKYPARTTVPA